MEVQELAPGLWRWTAPHPDWTPAEGGPEGWDEEVSSYYSEGRDAVVLFDPLVPKDDAAAFWRALDRDLERSAGRVHVLVTIYWHTRSTREIVERYGARVWAHTRARGAVARRAGAVSDAFRIGDALPGGIEAIAVPRGSEVVYWLPEQRALVTGDVILGERGGDLRLCPESWLQTGGHAELKTNLRPLLELPVERVLVCHGEPVLSDAHAKLERLLAA